MHIPFSMLILFGIFALVGIIWTIAQLPHVIVTLFSAIDES